IKTDISTTVLISMSVLMLLLILFYRKIYIPLLVFIPTVFAALFGMACLYLYKPVISAISLSVAAVLIGITIDYALHILTHYKKSGNVRALYRELTAHKQRTRELTINREMSARFIVSSRVRCL